MTRHRLLLVITLLAAGVYASGGPLGWSQTRAWFWAGTVLMVVGPLAGGLLAIGRGLRLAGRAKASWLLLGAGACAWACGQASYSVFELTWHTDPPFPGPPDVGFLAAAVLLALGAFRYPSVPGRGWSLVRSGLDAGLVMISTLLISWVLVLGDVYAAGGAGWAERVVGMAYPCGDVLVIGMLLLVVRRTPVGGRESLVVLLVGMSLMVLGDTGYLVLTERDAYYTGNPVDIGWWAGLFLVGLAARGYRSGEVPDGQSSLRSWAIFVPYAVTVAALTAVAVEAVATGGLDVFALGLAVVVVVLLLARQSVVALDSVSLASRLSQREAELRHHAYHDPLTQLPNRRSLRDHLEAELLSGRHAEAVCFIDLDGFKEINDTLGHEAGDALLREVSDRLRHVVRGEDVVARLGGDEFAVVLASGSDPAQAAQRLLARVREPIEVAGTTVTVSASIGVAPWSSGQTGEDLLRNADLAMYRAKANGRNQASDYEPGLHERATGRLHLQVALREALDLNEFRVHYQPLIDLDTNTMAGVEALVRWEHDGQLRAPAEFLQVAEDSGLIVPLGEWVLDQACADLATWRATGHRDLSLAVNLAARQLAEPDFADRVAAVLERRGIPAHLLTLEITENVLLEGEEQTHATLRALATLGTRLSLDDFGTGYASLSTLRTLPVTSVKIDRSFISELQAGPSALVDSIAYLADRHSLQVVAEGVETSRQRDMLRETGIAYAQGYHFARPMPADEIQVRLSELSALGSA